MISPLKDEADELYQKVFKDFFHDDVFDTDIIPQIRLINNTTPIDMLSIDMDLYTETTPDVSLELIKYNQTKIIKEIDKIGLIGKNTPAIKVLVSNTKAIMIMLFDTIYNTTDSASKGASKHIDDKIKAVLNTAINIDNAIFKTDIRNAANYPPINPIDTPNNPDATNAIITAAHGAIIAAIALANGLDTELLSANSIKDYIIFH